MYYIRGISVLGTNIRCINADSKHFLWAGSQDGLFKFDSKEAFEFNGNGLDKYRLGGSDIRDMSFDGTHLWLTSTQGGIDRINTINSQVDLHLSQDQFPTLENGSITSICKEKEILYVGTERGLYYYNIFRNTTGKISLKAISVNCHIDKLFFYKAHLVVLLRDIGIYVYNIENNELLDTVTTVSPTLKYHRFYSVAQGPSGQYYLGTSRGLSKIFVGSNGHLTYLETPFGISKKLILNDIYAVALDKQKKLWCSTENFLLTINIVSGDYAKVENAIENTENFLKSVYSIYCDSDDNIWLGCQSGLFYLKNAPPSSVVYHKSRVGAAVINNAYYPFPVNDSLLLVTGENGIYKINRQNGVITEVDISGAYDFVLRDPFNKILVSNLRGLNYFHNDKFIPISEIYKEFKNYANFTVNSAIEINHSKIVFGTENGKGILIWDFINHIVKNVTTDTKNLVLENNIVNGLFKIKENVFCVLSESSIILIDLVANSSKRIAIKKPDGRSEYGLFFDMCRANGMYYVSSYGSGVIILDTQFRQIQVINVSNGLTNNSIYKLLPWEDKQIFMTSNFGLNIYDINSKTIKQIFKSDGLQDNVFEETSGNIWRNVLFVGGKNGVTEILPNNLKKNKHPPYLYYGRIVTDFKGGLSSDTTNVEIEDYNISNSYIQVKIFISAINYSNPERTKFAYRITEKGSEWINQGSQNYITLIGQPPGTYHLQVRAANEEGIWSESKELILIFEPKWYQTWWFYLLIVLIVAAILYALYRYRVAQIKKQHQIRKNIATDLHDDLGSTLNSVKVFTNLAIRGIKQEESLQQVKDNLTEATMSLRDMIWVLDDSLDTVDELITRLKQFAIPVAAASNIKANIKADSDVNTRQLTKEEKRNLFLICKEAINNSIKYSGASQIDVGITASGKKIQIVVADNGKGFNVDTVKKGYGLKNMKYRAVQIKYKVGLTSTIDLGTQVVIHPL